MPDDATGTRALEDDLEIVLGVADARNRRLLQWPSRQTLGGEPARDLERGGVQLRIGRKPLARSLQTLYRSRGRIVPDDYEVFWGHELWLVDHTVGIIRYDGSEDIDHLCCELAFPDDVTVVEVLPQPRFISETGGRHACEADIGLNGRASVLSGSRTQDAGTSSSTFARGARLAMYDGPPAILAAPTADPRERDPLLGRVSFDVMTPHVQAIGAGDNASQYVFSRHTAPLTGYQSMLAVLLVNKHARELHCSARLQAVMTGLNGVPVRMRSEWIPLDITLDAAASRQAVDEPRRR
jgi:hypothetical protein